MVGGVLTWPLVVFLPRYFWSVQCVLRAGRAAAHPPQECHWKVVCFSFFKQVWRGEKSANTIGWFSSFWCVPVFVFFSAFFFPLCPFFVLRPISFLGACHFTVLKTFSFFKYCTHALCVLYILSLLVRHFYQPPTPLFFFIMCCCWPSLTS